MSGSLPLGLVVRSLPLVLAVLVGCAGPRSSGMDLVAQPFLAHRDWQQPAEHCQLPPALDEASGLEHDPDHGLVALHDNASTLYRVSCAGVTALRGPSIDGDFEGLTRHGDRWLLLTSPGGLYSAALTADGLTVADGPRQWSDPSRALAGRCGFEGIASVAPDVLFIACKYPREPQPGRVLLIRLGPVDGSAQSVEVDVSTVLAATGLSRLRPSGLAWLPEQARLLVLVGKERVLMEVDASGRLLAWRRLARRWHRQAEGLAVLPDGRIAIVDEADGRRATLTVYGPPRP